MTVEDPVTPDEALDRGRTVSLGKTCRKVENFL